MARLSTYQQDADPQGTDKLIGTDSSGLKTRNFSLSSVGQYLNRSNQLAVARQSLFNFQETVTPTRVKGSVSLPNGGVTTFQATTSVVVSKKTAGDVAVDELMQYGNGKNVVIFNPYELNDFAEYEVLSSAEWVSDSSFMQLTLRHIEGSGAWIDATTFGFAFFSSEGDKHYEHAQEMVSTVWQVNHNLNKYPSVTVVDSGNNVLLAEVSYIDKDNLEVRFGYSTSGKAYLN